MLPEMVFSFSDEKGTIRTEIQNESKKNRNICVFMSERHLLIQKGIA